MAVTMHQHIFADLLPQLRQQPTIKRIRVLLGGEVIADTTQARLVWEPRRVVPAYAIPEAALTAELIPTPESVERHENPVHFGDGPPLLDPRTGFAAHTTPGQALTVATTATRADAAAYRPADPDLAGYVILDFAAFDWLEEDEQIIGHPRDPFSRIDIRRSSRHVRFEHQGVPVADSRRPHLLFQATFPIPRYYLPREDVLVELAPGTLHTSCAYKGHATHFSATVGDELLPDIAWSYQDPLPDAEQVRNMIALYQERLDLFVDGQLVPRVRTPWS